MNKERNAQEIQEIIALAALKEKDTTIATLNKRLEDLQIERDDLMQRLIHATTDAVIYQKSKQQWDCGKTIAAIKEDMKAANARAMRAELSAKNHCIQAQEALAELEQIKKFMEVQEDWNVLGIAASKQSLKEWAEMNKKPNVQVFPDKESSQAYARARIAPIEKDNGEHYRYSYTVPVSQADTARGTITINLDPYRIIQIYSITHPAQQHLLKKVLATGQRTQKDIATDIQDIICSCNRWLQMIDEDALLVGKISPPQIQDEVPKNTI